MAVATAPVATESLTRAATEARGLAMDSIASCHSGHLGLPLGCAEIGAVLFGHEDGLTYNPEDPQWINRDRFVLSAGHGSMFLYSWLHLAGYDLPLEEVKNFRRHHSMTPGHPEFPNSEHNTPGVEATTGPLGQGVANAAGMAAAAKMAAAKFNTPAHEIFSNTIVALCGDGCIQEGISGESAAFAAQEGLDNLIIIYDSNDVTLDKMAEFTMKEDTAMRYKSYGWDVITLDGHDINSVSEALKEAKSNKNGKPTIIIAKTIIGKGISAIEGTNAAHGEAGVKYTDESRKALGLPEEKWYVSPDTRAFFKDKTSSLKVKYSKWQDTYKAWKSANPELAKLLQSGIDQSTPTAVELLKVIPEFDQTKNIATREAGSVVLQPLADAIPLYVSGSADLHGSNKNYIKNGGDFGVNFGKTYTGRNFYYGIREHAMGAILNGIAYFGLFRASGATFLVFADYLRATIRVASLAELPVGYILTHDSVGVGEDGPTHQPVETVTGLRIIPNLDVIRPADPEETAAAYAASIERKEGPTALILTRQNVRTLSEIPVSVRREGTLKGAYVAKKETTDLELIILASGSEVQWAMDVAKDKSGVRVVSMPSMYRFDRQPQSYKESVLPASCTKRVSIEAGVTPLWWKYVGTEGKVLGTDKFGLSAPGDKVMEVFGMTAASLKKEVEAML
jgi:transketolase